VSRRRLLLPILAVLAWAVLCVAIRTRFPTYSTDQSIYLGLADSLAEGRGYVFDGEVHTKYPPGLPLLLAATRGVLGDRFGAHLAVTAVAGAVGLLLAFLLLARERSRSFAAVAVLLLATSPALLELPTRWVLSDLPWFAAVHGALLLAVARRRRGHVALGVLLVAAVILRTASVAVLAGFVAWGLARRKRARRLAPPVGAAVLALAGGLVAAAALRPGVPPGEEIHHYGTEILAVDPENPEAGRLGPADVVRRVVRRGTAEASHFAAALLRRPFVAPLLLSPLVLLPAALALAGALATLRRETGSLLAWVWLAYQGMLALMPTESGARYQLVLFPVTLLLIARGGEALARRLREDGRPAWLGFAAAGAALAVAALLHPPGGGGLQAALPAPFWGVIAIVSLAAAARPPPLLLPPRPAERAAAGAALVLALLGAPAVAGLARENLVTGPRVVHHEPAVRAGRWLRAHSAPDDVAMAEGRAVLHLVSGRRTAPIPLVSDPAAIGRAIDRRGVRFLVVRDRHGDPRFVRPRDRWIHAFVRARGAGLRAVHRGRGFTIYEVARPR